MKRECSFCDKPEGQDVKVVTGPGVNICSECVEASVKLLKGTLVEGWKFMEGDARCGFCGKRASQGIRIVSVEDGKARICEECVALCLEVVNPNTGKIHIMGIDHVALWVKDLKRSVEWYKEMLNLKEDHGDDQHVFLNAGNQVIALFQASPGQDIGNPHHIALRLWKGEKEKALDSLRSKGVEILDSRGHFQDPDGHRFHFV